MRELQEIGYIRYEDLPLETKNGQRVDVEVVANIYQENRQRVIQCNIRDITARSRMEKKLQEQTVALADLHRRKDEFLAMLSHELRSPLAPIYNAVQILRLQALAITRNREATSPTPAVSRGRPKPPRRSGKRRGRSGRTTTRTRRSLLPKTRLINLEAALLPGDWAH